MFIHIDEVLPRGNVEKREHKVALEYFEVHRQFRPAGALLGCQ